MRPGWYQDPDDDRVMRYHDGAGWTEHVKPLPQHRGVTGRLPKGYDSWTPDERVAWHKAKAGRRWFKRRK